MIPGTSKYSSTVIPSAELPSITAPNTVVDSPQYPHFIILTVIPSIAVQKSPVFPIVAVQESSIFPGIAVQETPVFPSIAV